MVSEHKSDVLSKFTQYKCLLDINQRLVCIKIIKHLYNEIQKLLHAFIILAKHAIMRVKLLRSHKTCKKTQVVKFEMRVLNFYYCDSHPLIG